MSPRSPPKPGEQLQVVLTNIGTAPVEVMGHILDPLPQGGFGRGRVCPAAASHKDTGYMPPELQG